jgi:hypothetical protein
MTLLKYALLLAALSLPLSSVEAQTDSLSLKKELSDAARNYENSKRSSAQHRLMQNMFCDEQVGRYCLIYDRGILPTLPGEPEQVTKARDRAIVAFQKAVAAWPSDSTIVAPLIRYLVEADRGAEAVQVAQQFKEVTTDKVWAMFLLGFAQHGARDDAAADETFARALHDALPSERQEMHDVTFILSRDERAKYQAFTGPLRARYLERLWRLADPLYLTPGNESLVEHLSRKVYTHILALAPTGEEGAWAADQEALTIRFGVPTARTYSFGQTGQKSLIEHYDPDQLTYVPPALVTKGGLPRAEPGSAWVYDTVRANSGFAPRTLRRMKTLEHQVERFPAGDSTLVRADFTLTLDDSVKLPARVQVALFVLDSTYDVIAAVVDTMNVEAAKPIGTLSVRAPASAAAYSLEAMELGTRLANRARYALPVMARARLTLSDVVLFAASDAPPPSSRTSAQFTPFASLLLARGTPIGVYLEARGLSRTPDRMNRYRVDLEVLEQEKPGVFSRAVRSLGRALGLQGNDVAPKISFTQNQPAGDPAPIGIKLGSIQLEPGLKQFRVTVTDLQTNASVVTDRLVRVVEK